MAAHRLFLSFLTATFTLLSVPLFAQRKIPGAPSNAPVHVDATKKGDDHADLVGAFFENVNLWTNYLREQKISGALTNYLNDNSIKPAPGEVHIFYVKAFTDSAGAVDLQDFQYLTKGKSFDDALRESFAIDNAPGGPEGSIDAKPRGTEITGIYVSATTENGELVIRGGPLDKDYYQKIRKEGLELRDKRLSDLAEAQRNEAIRQKRAATHAASDAEAQRQLRVVRAKGPSRSGVEMSGSGPLTAKPSEPNVYLPPTKSGAPQPTSPTAALPPQALPKAPPPVKFNQPPPPPTPPTTGPAINGPT